MLALHRAEDTLDFGAEVTLNIDIRTGDTVEHKQLKLPPTHTVHEVSISQSVLLIRREGMDLMRSAYRLRLLLG